MEATQPDDAFWHAAYTAHGSDVLAFLRRRVSREEAEDVLQETFVRAIRAGTFRGDHGQARAYLMSAARHVLINHLRRPRLVVAAADAAPAQTENGSDALTTASSPDATPEENAARSAFSRRLEGVVAKLRDNYRRAFELAVLEQHSYAEVAQMTGWSLPQVKINVYRARKRVIEDLGDVLPEAGQRNPVPEAGQRNPVPEAGQRKTVLEAGRRKTVPEAGRRKTVPEPGGR